MHFTLPVVIKLAMTAVALGFGYAAWNTGILHGVAVLAAASYFHTGTLLGAGGRRAERPLSFSFWQGAFMVCGGSLLCWWATRPQ
jgi:hypothetical protein